MQKNPCVYILANKPRGTLYVGVTTHLISRIWEHKTEAVKGFTEQYGVDLLVWYEQHETMDSAIKREKSLKVWRRVWKIALVEKNNATWKDLYPDVVW